MHEADWETISYTGLNRQVSWRGISMPEGNVFESFLTTDVVARLQDEEGRRGFEVHLRGLSSTGFAKDSLDQILAAEVTENRDWAIGEAIAEAYLTRKYDITWPWNMERDKRIPSASLPGADLVGFEAKGEEVRLAFGEVKTSNDTNTPPNVMYGRSGMKNQIDNLASNLALINQLLKWLLFRCKGTKHEVNFNAAIKLFLNSGNRAVALFGVLIRDTKPNELDLQGRGDSLAETLRAPSTCQLLALYLPCNIVNLSERVSGGRSL